MTTKQLPDFVQMWHQHETQDNTNITRAAHVALGVADVNASVSWS